MEFPARNPYTMREPSYKTDLISELALEAAPWPLLILYGLQEVTGKG